MVAGSAAYTVLLVYIIDDALSCSLLRGMEVEGVEIMHLHFLDNGLLRGQHYSYRTESLNLLYGRRRYTPSIEVILSHLNR